MAEVKLNSNCCCNCYPTKPSSLAERTKRGRRKLLEELEEWLRTEWENNIKELVLEKADLGQKDCKIIVSSYDHKFRSTSDIADLCFGYIRNFFLNHEMTDVALCLSSHCELIIDLSWDCAE